MTEMNKAVMGTGENNMQLVARMLKQYSEMFKGTYSMIAAEMAWLSDVAAGEHAEMHRLLALANNAPDSVTRHANKITNSISVQDLYSAFEEAQRKNADMSAFQAFAAGTVFATKKFTDYTATVPQ